MTPIYLFLLFLSALCSNAGAQERANNKIVPNSSLTPTGSSSSWPSPSGLYAFGFYKIGSGYAVGVFMAGIPAKTVVWTSNRDNAFVSDKVTLLITADGRLVLQQPQGQDLTNIVSLGEKVSSASMLDSGNFVLYNSANRMIWQSFEHPTDTLLPGMHLAADQQLFSSVSQDDPSTGPFRLIMQGDGNLVQYPTEQPTLGKHAYYASFTVSNGLFVTLNLDTNGYMYLLINDDTIIFNLTQGYPEEGLIYRATVDVDGIFRLYSISRSFNGTWTMKFQTTADKCDPIGICGFNAYCTMQDYTESVCKCFPGFDFSLDSNKTCERNFSTSGCKIPSPTMNFDMRFLENTLFDDDAYITTKVSAKEECAEACRKDCNCDAALFNDGECGKQRLPLRYGQRKMDDDTTGAMVKIGMMNMPSTEGNAPTEESPRSQPKKKKAIIASSVSVGCLFLAILTFILWTWRNKHRGAKYRTKFELGKISEKSKLEELPLYSYETIARITDNFDVNNKLGQGGFGPVYKGKLVTGQEIAVKRLSNYSSQGIKEFMNEVTLISKLQHRNLVKLLGCCVERDEKMLVYEYLPNKSLDTYIFEDGKQDLLDWKRRCLIIEGIGRGLLYLHRDSRLRIIHRDMKASNILLDTNLNPKISDFGLARIFGGEQDQANTNRVVGTYGYMAPEYAMEGKFSEKSDVYSFGVLLLEIVSGRRNTSFYLDEENISLLGYAWKLWNVNEAVNLAYTEQLDSIVETEIRRFTQVGLLCVQDNPNDRPNMSNVLSMLNSEMADLPCPKLPVYTSTLLVSEDHCYPQSRPSNNGISVTELHGR